MFFGISVLVTLSLSIIMKPETTTYWIFLYLFSTSQLFLFFHSILYWYYTTKKFETRYPVAKRSTDFDKKTLTIVSAYDEDPEVLEATFIAIKESFTGDIMLAVDSPQNVKSYIELCRKYDVICIHRIHRSGFKAGAINNVVLNFLKNQPEYIRKTKRSIADEIVSTLNNPSHTLLLNFFYEFENIKKVLSSIDESIKSSYSRFIYENISQLVSGVKTNYLQPSDLDKIHLRIVQLKKLIDEITRNHNVTITNLSRLNDAITQVNKGITPLFPVIKYLQSETELTFDQLTSMHVLQLISDSDSCMKVLNDINGQKFLEFKDKKNELFTTIQNIEKKINIIQNNWKSLDENSSNRLSPSTLVNKEQKQLNYNQVKELQLNLRSINSGLSLLNKSIKSSYNYFVYEHISQLTSGVKTNYLQPSDLDKLRIIIKTQQSKLDEIDKNIELLYEENLYNVIERIDSRETKLFDMNDLKLLYTKINSMKNELINFKEMMKITKDISPNIMNAFTEILNKFEQSKIEITNDEKNIIRKIEDLICEFGYTTDDLVAKIPLNIEFIVLLDSDAHPKSDTEPQNNFFDLGAKYIQENDLVVFPQFYNKEQGPLVQAAYAQQVPFMKTIMPKRGEDNTAFMLGTNIMIKRKTLEDVSGFDESTVTEDLATTIKIHESKAKSKYIDKDVVVNGAPLSILGYFTQQQRWAFGTYQVLFKMLLKGVGKDLNLKRYIEYIYGNTWYFYGLAFVFNALIPFYSIFWEGLIQIPADLFYVLYLPYVFSGIIIFLYSILRTGHGFKDAFLNMSLNAICFSVYIRALAFALLGKKLPFEVTPKSKSAEETFILFKKILPILVVIGLLEFSSIMYAAKMILGDVSILSGTINIIWSTFFVILLYPIFRFK